MAENGGVLSENLHRLLEQLKRYAREEPTCEGRREPHPAAESLARNLPLAHSRGTAGLRRICASGGIFSREELTKRNLLPPPSKAETPVEVTLGTFDFVFTYAAPFRYPATSCGLLFRPDAESRPAHRALATPFDSGGILHHLRPSDSREEQIAFCRRHEMPVPGYRTYLATTLTYLFRSPWHYIDGTGPDIAGPIALEGGDSRRWTFEVRFLRELPLAGNLLAVFLPVAVAHSEWGQEHIVRWKRDGTDIRLFVSPTDGAWDVLQRKCVEYLEEHLGRNHAGEAFQSN